mmetsp:Transcript_9921/g.25875  ORF Transcript_9921/g.25875 Transcript_9921/m.25875 type:complete len:306 (-) Transcript_9921:69-986(-)
MLEHLHRPTHVPQLREAADECPVGTLLRVHLFGVHLLDHGGSPLHVPGLGVRFDHGDKASVPWFQVQPHHLVKPLMGPLWLPRCRARVHHGSTDDLVGGDALRAHLLQPMLGPLCVHRARAGCDEAAVDVDVRSHRRFLHLLDDILCQGHPCFVQEVLRRTAISESIYQCTAHSNIDACSTRNRLIQPVLRLAYQAPLRAALHHTLEGMPRRMGTAPAKLLHVLLDELEVPSVEEVMDDRRSRACLRLQIARQHGVQPIHRLRGVSRSDVHIDDSIPAICPRIISRLVCTNSTHQPAILRGVVRE